MDMQVEMAERAMDRAGAEADNRGQAYADLRADFIEALTAGELRAPLPTPAFDARHTPAADIVADMMAGEGDETLAQMLAVLGAAASGKPVRAAASALIHALAHRYAAHQIDGSDWGSA